MRKLLLSGASVALLSLGAAALPSLADSPSTIADPVGDATRVQLADSGTNTTNQNTTTQSDTTGSETTGASDATGTTASDGTTVDPAASGTDTDATTTTDSGSTAQPIDNNSMQPSDGSTTTGSTTLGDAVDDAADTASDAADDAVDATQEAADDAADAVDDAADEAADAVDADEPAPTGQLQAEAVQPPETVAVDEILDADVVDVNGEDVASVYDVLMGPDGKLSHVVVSYGGFLGIGTKEVLVPWEQVSYNAAQGTMQIQGNEADLEAAPGFVTQEELQDQQEAERQQDTAPSTTGDSVPQQAQTPDPE